MTFPVEAIRELQRPKLPYIYNPVYLIDGPTLKAMAADRGAFPKAVAAESER